MIKVIKISEGICRTYLHHNYVASSGHCAFHHIYFIILFAQLLEIKDLRRFQHILSLIKRCSCLGTYIHLADISSDAAILRVLFEEPSVINNTSVKI